MTESPMPLPIVVGVDGSKFSERALDWAIDEASRRGRPLWLICAWAMDYTAGMIGRLIPFIREGCDRVLADARQRVTSRAPTLTVTTQTIQGQPAAALIDASARACPGGRRLPRARVVPRGARRVHVHGGRRSRALSCGGDPRAEPTHRSCPARGRRCRRVAGQRRYPPVRVRPGKRACARADRGARVGRQLHRRDLRCRRPHRQPGGTGPGARGDDRRVDQPLAREVPERRRPNEGHPSTARGRSRGRLARGAAAGRWQPRTWRVHPSVARLRQPGSAAPRPLPSRCHPPRAVQQRRSEHFRNRAHRRFGGAQRRFGAREPGASSFRPLSGGRLLQTHAHHPRDGLGEK